MTKYRKKVEEHVEEHWEEDKTLCDFCHRNVELVSGSSFDATEITLDAKIGPIYPEGDTRTGYRIDCCEDCFEQKVKVAVESLGVKWHEYSADESYVRSGPNDYWVDNVRRIDGKLISDAEEKPVRLR